MRSYISFLTTKDLDTLERYLEDAREELRFYKNGGDPDEIAEAQQHVDDILTAIDLKGG